MVIVNVLVSSMVVVRRVVEPDSSVVVSVVATVSTVVLDSQSSQWSVEESAGVVDGEAVVSKTGLELVLLYDQSDQVCSAVELVVEDSAGVVELELDVSATGVELVLL